MYFIFIIYVSYGILEIFQFFKYKIVYLYKKLGWFSSLLETIKNTNKRTAYIIISVTDGLCIKMIFLIEKNYNIKREIKLKLEVLR